MASTPLRALAATGLLSVGLMWGQAFSQESEPYYPDPPERAARLSYLEGEVSLQPAGEDQWAPAIVNRPMTTGDKLWTERDARAEIYVGPAAVRLAGETGFSFLNVDDDTIQMRVTAGVMNVIVRNLEGGENIEIATPNVALSILRDGHYRVEVNDSGDTTVVKVSEGSVQATGSSQDVVVYAQQVATFSGVDNLVAQFGTLGGPDEFDRWTLDRDRRDEQADSSRTAEYVSPEVTGYQDLDANGTWSSEPEYGYVWTPSYVAVGWAPYRYGRWVTVAPWGWTWIDDAPWGYAPFHYGRWAHVRHRWCWVPGPRHVRPVYAPAHVGWVGTPGHSVSWFPLGPRDVYMPGHRHSRHYVERVNVSNTIVNRMFIKDAYERGVSNHRYVNRTAPNAVTAVSRTAFTTAGRTGNQRIRFSEPELAQSVTSAVAPRIAAGRESRLGGPTRTNVRVPPRTIADRQVVVRREPPATNARYARRPPENREVGRSPEREVHPRNRDQDQWRSERPATIVRDRSDRPPRVDRPVGEAAPPAPTVQSSVFDRRALSDRVREDRDRQVREGLQQQRDTEHRQRQAEYQRREVIQRQQNEAATRQRWQQQAEQPRERREQSPPPRVEQRSVREHVQRQVETSRQAPPPRAEHREQRAERPAHQPRAEQPSRSEAPRPPPESRSQAPKSTEGRSRHNRN